jgi:hypothetical protein
MRFTIRELLLTTAIVSLSLGWWLDHWRLATQLSKEKSRSWDMQFVARKLAQRLKAKGEPGPYLWVWGKQFPWPDANFPDDFGSNSE